MSLACAMSGYSRSHMGELAGKPVTLLVIWARAQRDLSPGPARLRVISYASRSEPPWTRLCTSLGVAHKTPNMLRMCCESTF